jgi:hypothetical protein
LDTSTFPADWVVTYTDIEFANNIEIPSFDADSEAVYSVEYTVTLDVDSSWSR